MTFVDGPRRTSQTPAGNPKTPYKRKAPASLPRVRLPERQGRLLQHDDDAAEGADYDDAAEGAADYAYDR